MTTEPKVFDVSELVEEEELAVRGEGGPKFAAVQTLTGEEDYECVWEQKARIMWFDEGENKYKERGSGDARILNHKTKKGNFQFLFRRDGIGKIAAQHLLVSGMRVIAHPKDARSSMWIAPKDYSDDECGWPEKFCIRFASEEHNTEFMKKFGEICK